MLTLKKPLGRLRSLTLAAGLIGGIAALSTPAQAQFGGAMPIPGVTGPLAGPMQGGFPMPMPFQPPGGFGMPFQPQGGFAMPFQPPGGFGMPFPPQGGFGMPVPPQGPGPAGMMGMIPPDGFLVAQIAQQCGGDPSCMAAQWARIEMSRCANGIGVPGGCFGPNGEIARRMPEHLQPQTVIRNAQNDAQRGPGRNNDLVGCNGALPRAFGVRC